MIIRFILSLCIIYFEKYTSTHADILLLSSFPVSSSLKLKKETVVNIRSNKKSYTSSLVFVFLVSVWSSICHIIDLQSKPLWWRLEFIFLVLHYCKWMKVLLITETFLLFMMHVNQLYNWFLSCGDVGGFRAEAIHTNRQSGSITRIWTIKVTRSKLSEVYFVNVTLSGRKQ